MAAASAVVKSDCGDSVVFVSCVDEFVFLVVCVWACGFAVFVIGEVCFVAFVGGGVYWVACVLDFGWVVELFEYVCCIAVGSVCCAGS